MDEQDRETTEERCNCDKVEKRPSYQVVELLKKLVGCENLYRPM